MIFVGIPKNGSTSIHLSLYDSNESVEGLHNSHNHTPIWEEAKYPYEMVCMSKNPYDRFISAYKMFPGRLNPNQKLRNFISMGWDNFINNEVHFRPMWWFTTMNGKFWMDKVLRIEESQDWVDFMKTRQEGMIRPLVRENVSQEPNPILDNESIQMINYLYRDDFRLFNYPMIQL